MGWMVYLGYQRTVSSVHLRAGAGCFAQEDGCVWVVLLHGRVSACEECPVYSRSVYQPHVDRFRGIIPRQKKEEIRTHLVAALVSPWQNKKRTSFRDLVKAYLPDIFSRCHRRGGGLLVGLGAIETATS